jgi:hypothetical protein
MVTPILRCDSAETIVSGLIDRDIRYFLIPCENNPNYVYYSHFFNEYQLFKTVTLSLEPIIVNDTVYQFTLLSSFRGAKLDLYVLSSHSIVELANISKYSFSPVSLADSQASSFKTTTSDISLSDALQVGMEGTSTLRIQLNSDTNPDEYIYHQIVPQIDLSDKDFLSFNWYGQKTGARIAVQLQTSNWRNQFEFTFSDSWFGWARLIIPFDQFKVLIGAPNLGNMTSVGFVVSNLTEKSTFYLDNVLVDKDVDAFKFIPIENDVYSNK